MIGSGIDNWGMVSHLAFFLTTSHPHHNPPSNIAVISDFGNDADRWALVKLGSQPLALRSSLLGQLEGWCLSAIVKISFLFNFFQMDFSGMGTILSAVGIALLPFFYSSEAFCSMRSTRGWLKL